MRVACLLRGLPSIVVNPSRGGHCDLRDRFEKVWVAKFIAKHGDDSCLRVDEQDIDRARSVGKGDDHEIARTDGSRDDLSVPMLENELIKPLVQVFEATPDVSIFEYRYVF